jgi:hypothetical protein
VDLSPRSPFLTISSPLALVNIRMFCVRVQMESFPILLLFSDPCVELPPLPVANANSKASQSFVQAAQAAQAAAAAAKAGPGAAKNGGEGPSLPLSAEGVVLVGEDGKPLGPEATQEVLANAAVSKWKAAAAAEKSQAVLGGAGAAGRPGAAAAAELRGQAKEAAAGAAAAAAEAAPAKKRRWFGSAKAAA